MAVGNHYKKNKLNNWFDEEFYIQNKSYLKSMILYKQKSLQANVKLVLNQVFLENQHDRYQAFLPEASFGLDYELTQIEN